MRVLTGPFGPVTHVGQSTGENEWLWRSTGEKSPVTATLRRVAGETMTPVWVAIGYGEAFRSLG